MRTFSCGHPAPQPAGTPPPATPYLPIGVNLNFAQSYISSIHFGDLAKQSGSWKKITTNGSKTGLDASRNVLGYPTEPATSRVFTQTFQVPLRTGGAGNQIILTYNEGDLTATQRTVVSLQGSNVFFENGTTNPVTGDVRKYYTLGVNEQGLPLYAASVDILVSQLNDIDLNTTNGDGLDLQLHLWVDAAHEQKQIADPTDVFFDQYLLRQAELGVSYYRSGPDWSRNNTAGSLVGGWTPDWNTRRLPGDSRWSEGLEVPWEVHCWLANQMNVDLWVCIPLITFDPEAGIGDADYDRAEFYTRELAKFIKANLDPEHHCIVEWSNEMWNSKFTTNAWLTELANRDGNMSPIPDDLAVYAADIVELTFGWWLDEWNDCRVETAVMGHATNTVWAQTIGARLAQWNMVDAVGCTIYMQPEPTVTEFGWLEDPTCSTTPTNDTIGWNTIQMATKTALEADTSATIPGNTAFIRNHGDVAAGLQRQDGKEVFLYVYECGPHFIPGNQMSPCADQLRKAYTGIQNEDQMRPLITEMLNRFLLPYDATTNQDGVQTPLPRLVDRMTYFAFAQTKDQFFGSFYLLEDLYAGLGTAVSIIHDDPQVKFEEFVAFITSWMN